MASYALKQASRVLTRDSIMLGRKEQHQLSQIALDGIRLACVRLQRIVATRRMADRWDSDVEAAVCATENTAPLVLGGNLQCKDSRSARKDCASYARGGFGDAGSAARRRKRAHSR